MLSSSHLSTVSWINSSSFLLNPRDLVAIGFTSEKRFENKDTASTFAAVKVQLDSFDCITNSGEVPPNSKTSRLC